MLLSVSDHENKCIKVDMDDEAYDDDSEASVSDLESDEELEEDLLPEIDNIDCEE